MSAWELAQINVGRLVAPVGDPAVAEFVAGLDPINALAESSTGFRWRLKSDGGNATDIPFDDDPLTIVNMSVWASWEALRDFTYGLEHAAYLKQRRNWFAKPDAAHSCLWWVAAGHRPTVAEGRGRLLHYRERGPTAHAFWHPHLFPAPGA